MAKENQYVLELLTENGLLTEHQIHEAAEYAKNNSNDEHTVSTIEAAIALKFISEQDYLQVLANEYGMEVIDLNNYDIPEEVLASLTPDIVNTYNVIPVMRHDDILTVAMSDPSDMDTLDALRYLLGCDVDAVIAPQDQIQRIQGRCMAPQIRRPFISRFTCRYRACKSRISVHGYRCRSNYLCYHRLRWTYRDHQGRSRQAR